VLRRARPSVLGRRAQQGAQCAEEGGVRRRSAQEQEEMIEIDTVAMAGVLLGARAS